MKWNSPILSSSHPIYHLCGV